MLYDRNMVLNLSSRLCCIIWRKETLVANISKQVNGSMCIYTPGAMLVSGRLIHVTPAQCAGSEISTGHGFNQSNATCAELHNDDTTLPQQWERLIQIHETSWDRRSWPASCWPRIRITHYATSSQQIPSKSHSCFTHSLWSRYKFKRQFVSFSVPLVRSGRCDHILWTCGIQGWTGEW